MVSMGWRTDTRSQDQGWKSEFFKVESQANSWKMAPKQVVPSPLCRDLLLQHESEELNGGPSLALCGVA